MSGMHENLSLISLEKYADAFINLGFSQFEDLLPLGPAELDRAFTEAGMLKGHTFKLKKMIEDAKAGVPKPKPVQAPVMMQKPEPVMPVKSDLLKPAEKMMAKDMLEKANGIKSQLESIVQTKEALILSLKQFLELDLNPYFQALNQIKTMQSMVKDMLQPDVEMVNQ